jgi:hypothetical protein
MIHCCGFFSMRSNKMLLLKTAQSLILVSPTGITHFFLHNYITKQAVFNEYQSVIGFPRLKKKDIIIGLAALPCP